MVVKLPEFEKIAIDPLRRASAGLSPPRAPPIRTWFQAVGHAEAVAAEVHALDDVGQHHVRRRGDADLVALLRHQAVEELDLGAAALHHVLAHRRPMLAAAPLTSASRCSS